MLDNDDVPETAAPMRRSDSEAHAFHAWLGPAAAELEERGALDRFARVWDSVKDRFPDEDDYDRREAALNAAAQYLLGDTTLEEVGRERNAAKNAMARASAAAGQVAILAVEDGVSQAEAARLSTIDRQYLRRHFLGK